MRGSATQLSGWLALSALSVSLVAGLVTGSAYREPRFGEFRKQKHSRQTQPLRVRHWTVRNADFLAPGKLVLADGQLTFTQGTSRRWMTPSAWWVDDLVMIMDHQPNPLLILSVWKEGNYGPARPFWVEYNDQRVRQHLFVYAMDRGVIRTVWQSSALPKPLCSMALSKTKASVTRLEAQEGTYAPLVPCRPDRRINLEWNGFGFSVDPHDRDLRSSS